MEENIFSVEYILENGLDKSAYGFIYISEYNVDKMKYIGLKIFDKRWQNYLGSGLYFKRALKLYGKENFSRKILAIAYSKEELDELEIEFIKNHNAVESIDYYNLQYGGHSGKHSQESKDKISNNHYNVSGENNPNYGVKMLEETKQKISKANTGKLKGGKSPLYGKHLSDERKKQISKVHKGKIISEQSKIKMSKSSSGENNPWYGKHLPEEIRRKISETRKLKQIGIGEMNGNAKKIICVNTKEVFNCIKDASIKYKINQSNISHVFCGRCKSAGRHPITNEKLQWQYYSEYIKLNPLPNVI